MFDVFVIVLNKFVLSHLFCGKNVVIKTFPSIVVIKIKYLLTAIQFRCGLVNVS